MKGSIGQELEKKEMKTVAVLPLLLCCMAALLGIRQASARDARDANRVGKVIPVTDNASRAAPVSSAGGVSASVAESTLTALYVPLLNLRKILWHLMVLVEKESLLEILRVSAPVADVALIATFMIIATASALCAMNVLSAEIPQMIPSSDKQANGKP
jgi:hypothetical protein